MGILAKPKQLNNGYFALPYALMGKAPDDPKTTKALFGGDSSDVQSGRNGHSAFIPKGKNRFTTSARVKLGVIHTIEKIFGHKAELSYRQLTAKVGHSSRTTAANLKELKEVLETPIKSTYHINAEYDGKPFILCYEFLFNEELQLEEGQAPVRLTDLEAILVSLIVNNKLNPKRSKDFVASVTNIEKALNIPHSTAQALIDRLIRKGVCKCFREYIDEKGNTVRVEGAKAKTKNEKTLLTVNSRIIRRCNVIYKEYKKRLNEKAAQRDVSKRSNGKQRTAPNQEPTKELSDEEKFDAIEAKFVQDKKYLTLTERYKALKAQSIDALLKDKDEGKHDVLEKDAHATFEELCYYLYGNGVSREQLPKTFARLIRNL